MKLKLLSTALALAVLAVVAGRVTAQETNTLERTFMTFSAPVEMPGVTLEPGTYVFKLADTGSRNVVEVWDKDSKHMIGHWTFVQSERPRVTEETVVMFKETREGATPAVQFWYFPNEKIGKEFLYPKDQAERIAARTGAKVRTDESADAGSAVAESAAVSPAPAEVAAEPAPAPAAVAEVETPAPAPAVAEVETPAAPPAPAPPVVAENRAEPIQAESPRAVGTSGQANELPRTASPLELSGLLGLLSLTGAAGLRAFRFRT